MASFARASLQGGAIVLFYIAVANGVLAENGGMCVQGAADQLVGIAYSIPLYLLAFGLLATPRASRDMLIVMLPGLVVALPQLWFAVRLAVGVYVWNQSACAVVENAATWEYDGREWLLAALWLLMFVIFVGGTVLVALRSAVRSPAQS